MKITQEMIDAFNRAVVTAGRALPVHPADVRAGLAAVLKVIDPVPDGVRVITDADGSQWTRNRYGDWNVWINNDRLPTYRTYGSIEENHGPAVWKEEGK